MKNFNLTKKTRKFLNKSPRPYNVRSDPSMISIQHNRWTSIYLAHRYKKTLPLTLFTLYTSSMQRSLNTNSFNSFHSYVNLFLYLKAWQIIRVVQWYAHVCISFNFHYDADIYRTKVHIWSQFRTKNLIYIFCDTYGRKYSAVKSSKNRSVFMPKVRCSLISFERERYLGNSMGWGDEGQYKYIYVLMLKGRKHFFHLPFAYRCAIVCCCLIYCVFLWPLNNITCVRRQVRRIKSKKFGMILNKTLYGSSDVPV